jgi:hypothetical protein
MFFGFRIASPLAESQVSKKTGKRQFKNYKVKLKTADIYEALVAQGYTFTFKEAKKVLGIRLYKMLGVQPLGDGLFKAK